MKLSIILPSIRIQNIPRLINSINLSCKQYDWELIVIGPYKPEIECKYIYSLACPNKCVQLGVLEAVGKYMMWSSDDGIYTENSIDECITLFDTLSEKDGIIIRYCEGRNFSGNCPDDSYWIGWTHDDQRLPGVDPNWKIAPVGMYNTKTFIELGGLDCKFEHINMSTHDLAYRIQKNGGNLYKSPSLVLSCDWSAGHLSESEHVPIHNAHFENDAPYFKQLYQSKNNTIKIDYNNYKNVPDIWRRFI